MPDDEDTQTILAARIPEALRARIREAAKREDRTESSFVRYHLGRIADQILSEEPKEATQP